MLEQEKITKTYLGDGVYADYVGHYIVLTTEDQYHHSNKIYLDDDVVDALRLFINKVRAE
jgi:23S rRNA maturation mini-RNase III